MSLIARNTIHCIDCMEGMREMPDNYVDLAIVDPPYGALAMMKKGTGTEILRAQGMGWDLPPTGDYFTKLLAVSKHCIVWGGNYFSAFLPMSARWVCWDKYNNLRRLPQFELAWTNTEIPNKIARIPRVDNGHLTKLHVAQKPVDLYKWLLANYAKEGDLILDTHIGSGSSYIACLDMGFDYIGYEIDEDYFKGIEDRVYHFTRQTSLALDAT